MDYSDLSTDELDDVARHLDRKGHPEVAREVDAELRRRARKGESATRVFPGGGRIGARGTNYRWPMASLRFNRETLTLRTTFLGIRTGQVTLARADVTGFRAINRWIGGGFEILHQCPGVEPYLIYRPHGDEVFETLREYGWPAVT